jgi:hypothetical protein
VTIDGVEFPIAFPTDDGGVLVNFGVLAGREATQAELDRLARALRRDTGGADMTITAERRQDYGPRAETVSHQVRVSFADSMAIRTPWLESVCHAWAVACAEERSIEPLS